MNQPNDCHELCDYLFLDQADVSVQERRSSSALAMELRLPCINPSEQQIVFEQAYMYYFQAHQKSS